METDMSPLYDNPMGPPPPKPHDPRDHVDTPTGLPPQHPDEEELLEVSPMYQHPPWPTHHAAAPMPTWDPFASIGTTAWLVMAIAFIMGFIIGKLR